MYWETQVAAISSQMLLLMFIAMRKMTLTLNVRLDEDSWSNHALFASTDFIHGATDSSIHITLIGPNFRYLVLSSALPVACVFFPLRATRVIATYWCCLPVYIIRFFTFSPNINDFSHVALKNNIHRLKIPKSVDSPRSRSSWCDSRSNSSYLESLTLKRSSIVYKQNCWCRQTENIVVA